jgi:hypothetical protein
LSNGPYPRFRAESIPNCSKTTHLLLGKNCIFRLLSLISIILSSLVRSVEKTVILIFFGSSPRKIFKAIVRSTAIRKMPAFHSLGSWSYESTKNQVVNVEHFPMRALFVQNNNFVTTGSCFSRFENPSRLEVKPVAVPNLPIGRANSPETGNGVKVLKSHYRLPNFNQGLSSSIRQPHYKLAGRSSQGGLQWS